MEYTVNTKEFRVVALRDCPTPESLIRCETPEHAVAYWQTHLKDHPQVCPDRECLVALFLNTRRRIKGHQLVTIGTLDTVLVHPREVFRVAIIIAASALVLMHNHPSGEAAPSEADIKFTRDLIRAGQLLRIEVLDHVIVGVNQHLSLRALGYFFS